MSYRPEIIRSMARALWANAWADNEDEQGRAVRGDIMDLMPQEIPPEATAKAESFYSEIEERNGINLGRYYDDLEEHSLESDAQRRAAMMEPTEEDFGHYLVMEGLGHGVAWSDDHTLDHNLQLPHLEFSIMDCDSLYTRPTEILRFEDLPEEWQSVRGIGIIHSVMASERGLTGEEAPEGELYAAERYDDGSVRVSRWEDHEPFRRRDLRLSGDRVGAHFSDPYTTRNDLLLHPVLVDQILEMSF